MLDIPDDQLDRITAAIYAGQKINAVKLYREATASGLKDAKDAVERLESELRAAYPERFSAKSGGGCKSTAVLLVVAAVLVAAGALTALAALVK